jgi:hypothetical protein
MRASALALGIIVLAAGSQSSAQTVVSNTVDSIGCKSWDTVKELLHSLAIGDKELWKHQVAEYVSNGECVALDIGDKIVITDKGFASFRFRFDGKFDQYWVPQ